MEKPRAQWKTEGLRGRPLESKCQLNGMSVTYGILMSFLDNQIIQIIIAMISGTVNQFEFLYNLWSFCIDSLTQHKYFDSLYCCMYQYFNHFFKISEVYPLIWINHNLFLVRCLRYSWITWQGMRSFFMCNHILSFFFFFPFVKYVFFFKFYFIFKLYIIVLVQTIK